MKEERENKTKPNKKTKKKWKDLRNIGSENVVLQTGWGGGRALALDC